MAEKSSSGEHVDASPPAAGGDTGSTGAGTTAEPREEELVDDPELEMLLDSEHVTTTMDNIYATTHHYCCMYIRVSSMGGGMEEKLDHVERTD